MTIELPNTHACMPDPAPLALKSNEGLGAGAKELEPWAAWKAKVDAIAAAEGLTPEANPLPGERDTWLRKWEDGKTPAQAWRAVPYRRNW